MLYQLPVRIDIVKDGISIGLMRSSEDDDLEVLISLFKTFHDIRSYIDSSLKVSELLT
jgi:hypothetical protein